MFHSSTCVSKTLVVIDKQNIEFLGRVNYRSKKSKRIHVQVPSVAFAEAALSTVAPVITTVSIKAK